MSEVTATTDPVQTAGAGRIDKPWGYELRWAITDRYLGKLIHVNAGHQLSLQYHEHKDEAIFVQRGVLDLILEDATGTLRTHRMASGMTARILPGRRHRFLAVEDVELFEVSSPEIDDVVRIEDSYGRAGTSA